MFSNPKPKPQGRCLLVQPGQMTTLGTIRYDQRWGGKSQGIYRESVQLATGQRTFLESQLSMEAHDDQTGLSNTNSGFYFTCES